MSPQKEARKRKSKQGSRPKKVMKPPEVDLDFQLPDVSDIAAASPSQQQEPDLKPTLRDIQSVLPSLLERRSYKAKVRRKPAAAQPQSDKPSNNIGAASRFATNAWVEGVVKSLQRRAVGFEEVKKAYDTVERDMFEVSNRWDRLISSLRNPFEESPKYVPDNDSGNSPDEKLRPSDLLEPVSNNGTGASLIGLNWLGIDDWT